MRAYYEKREYSPDFPLGIFTARNLTFPPHWHSDIEITYILKGEAMMNINGRDILLSDGGLAFCGSGDIHLYSNGTENETEQCILIFKPELVGRPGGWPESIFFEKPCLTKAEMVQAGIYEKIGRIFGETSKEMQLMTECYQDAVKSMLYELVTLIMRNSAQCPENKGRDGRMARNLEFARSILTYIEENFTEDISLKAAASRFNLSHYHFSRVFKLMFNKNFKEYLDEYRIHHAEILLQDKEKKITEIAYSCGFQSMRTFNRVYRKLKGYPPTQKPNVPIQERH